MTQEQETVLLIKGAITGLTPAEQESCREAAEQIRRIIKSAGDHAGPLAVALVGAEMQLELSK